MNSILPDIATTGLKLLICGTAVGPRSAVVREYYAGRNNQLWAILHKFGATPRLLNPAEFTQLQKFGIGLTDLAKNTHGVDSALTASAFDRKRLMDLVLTTQPQILVFNGKRAAKVYFRRRNVTYGHQSGQDIGTTQLFVAPSTSGAARRWWNEDVWREVMDTAGCLRWVMK